jgi:hypothetical protein
MWREGEIVFYLVSARVEDARRALPALGAPVRERRFEPSDLPGGYASGSSAS